MPYDVALIKEIKQLDKDIWIDGRVEDQFIWNTTVPRVNNFANPNNIVDYSKERSWVESLRAAGTLVENEEKGLKFQFHQALCEDNLEFRIWGNFSSKRLDVNRPVIKAIVDKNNIEKNGSCIKLCDHFSSKLTFCISSNEWLIFSNLT